ncbi:MAG TPA: hypothetical protein VJM82_04185 [Nitrospiraceae bacterium]|nr:hypothetical protein [Nitrospiraceae bacterium]
MMTLGRFGCVKSACGSLAGLIMAWLILGQSLVHTDEQGVASMAQPGREQGTGDLFNLWHFDGQQVGEAPAGFSARTVGDDASGTWKIEADPTAPSAPNVVVQAVPCPSGCFQMLLAEGFSYDYPDLAIRLRVTSPGSKRVGGAVFGVKDSRNFYAVVVDLATDTLEVIRVLNGKETVLGRASVKPWKEAWHLLRVQRNTILNKEFIETIFDNQLAVSVQDKALGAGQIGLVTRGETAISFDNFHAIPLYSQQLLSPPAAY